MSISSTTRLCMVIGSPISHSLSPAMHNAAFKALGIDDRYIYVASEISENQIDAFLIAMQLLRIKGVSCTAPIKNIIASKIDNLDNIAQEIGAVNTIVNTDNILTGYNTDWIGIVEPLKLHTGLENKRIAIVGAGGAAKAAAYGMSREKASITIFNRTLSKARELTRIFGGEALPLDAMTDLLNHDIIINTISDNLDVYISTGIYSQNISSQHILFDISYRKPSKLLAITESKGATIITGHEMLLYQGMAQFTLFTGLPAPEETMRAMLESTYKQNMHRIST
jgi:shikimate dehydrogenase